MFFNKIKTYAISGVTGFEPAAYGLTGHRANHLRYTPLEVPDFY